MTIDTNCDSEIESLEIEKISLSVKEMIDDIPISLLRLPKKDMVVALLAFSCFIAQQEEMDMCEFMEAAETLSDVFLK